MSFISLNSQLAAKSFTSQQLVNVLHSFNNDYDCKLEIFLRPFTLWKSKQETSCFLVYKIS